MSLIAKCIPTLFLSLSVYAEPLCIQEDKQKHFVGSMTIAGTATGIARYYGSSKIESFFIGVATSLLVGIGKEAIDGRGYGAEDVNDMYADTLGGITGSVISTNFSWKF